MKITFYFVITRMITHLIIYMKKFLHFDWLRAVQFFFKHCRRETIPCKKMKQTKHSDWSMIKAGQSNLLLSKLAHAQDGAIDGVIFSDCVTRMFLLLNHLGIFSCILLISNHIIFLVQFGINKHL